MKTLQEIFNKIWERSKTKKQAFGDQGCMYLDESGNRCFVGCLIEPEFYSEAFEGWNYMRPDISNALKSSGVNTKDIKIECLLSDARGIHDSDKTENWDVELRKLAAKFDLVVP